MKKLLFYFSIFAFSIICYSSEVSASSFVIDPATLESISTGFESLEYGGFFAYGLVPMEDGSPTSNYHSILSEVSGKRDLTTTITSENFTSIVPYQDMPYDLASVMSEWEIVDASGNIINDFDHGVYYATFDNGYFSGECLVNGNGQLLYKNVLGEGSEEVRQTLCDVAYGGHDMSAEIWRNTYQNASELIHDNGFSYNPTTQSGASSGSSYFVSRGIPVQGKPGQQESLFIANQYNPGTCVPVNTNNGSYINQWYANTLSVFQHGSAVGDLNTLSYETGNYVKGGITYRYRVTFASGYYGGTVNNTLANWLNGTDVYKGFLANTGTAYNSSIDNSNTASFGAMSASIAISQATAIGLDDLEDTVGKVVDLPWSPNKYWNPDLPFDDDNPAVVKDWTFDNKLEEVLPSGNEGTAEDDEDATVEDLEGEVVIPEDLSMDIPIINNLENRFPFSIPWDIKNMLKSLRAVGKAPKFDFAIPIAPLNYTWRVSLDLSPYSTQAGILRTCFLISFILGLAKFSYDHFFGS